MKDQRSCKCATGYYGDRCDKGVQINQQYKSNGLLQFLSRAVFIYWLYIDWYFKWRLATVWETELPARLEYSVSDDCIYRCRNSSRVRRELHRSQSPGGVLQLLQGKVGVPALAKREVSCERNDHWWQEVLLLPDIQGGLQPLRGQTIRGATEELVQSVFMHVVDMHFFTIWYLFCFVFFNSVPSMQKNFTHIKYSLKLSSDPEVFNNIIRDSTISLEYSCTFPYTRKVSLDFPIVPFSK